MQTQREIADTAAKVRFAYNKGEPMDVKLILMDQRSGGGEVGRGWRGPNMW